MRALDVIKRKNWPEEGLTRHETFCCCLIFFYAFFEGYLNSIIGNIGKFIILFAMFLIIRASIRRERAVFQHWYSVFFFFWLVYKIVTLLWTTDYAVASSHFLSQVGMVGLLLCLTCIEVGKRQLWLMLGSVAAGAVSMAVLSIFFAEPYMSYTSRFVLTLFGVQSDPNNIAATLLPGYVICLYCFLTRRRGRLFSLLCVAGAALCAFFILYTGSRGGMLSLGAMSLAVVFFPEGKGAAEKCSGRSLVMRRAILLALLVAGVVAAASLLPESTFERLFGGDYGDGSGRTELWATALDVFFSNPLFGAGWGAVNVFTKTAVHNTFLAMLCDVGALGTTLFLAPCLFVSFSSMRERSSLPALLILSACLPALFFDCTNKRFFWDLILLGIVAYNVYIVPRRGGSESASSRRRGA